MGNRDWQRGANLHLGARAWAKICLRAMIIRQELTKFNFERGAGQRQQMTNIHGDVFGRHRTWRLRLLVVVAMSLALPLFAPLDAPAQKHETPSSILSRHVTLKTSFAGRADSLISIIGRATGGRVAYSTRVLPRGEVRVRAGRHSVGECLDAIFGRYNVRYVCHDDKIVVAADSVRTRTVSGFCRDALTGEALIGAYVADTALGRVTSTNEYGFFSLSVPTGRVPVRASYVGYVAAAKEIIMSRDTMLELRLTPHIMLPTVDVRATAEPEGEMGSTGYVSLPMEQIKSMPTLLGESDVTHALQQTPGVQSGSEGFGGMSVRGGSQDQNMVYLDDAPLYNANHMLGLFSVFNSEAVSKSTLLKSGFPARYGGRMSSVLDIKTIDGDMSRFEGCANVSLVASTLLAQGPMKRDRSSFLFSARRSYFDVLLYPMQKSNNRYTYLFYDFHSKFNWRVSDRGRLRLSLFFGRDRLSDDSNLNDIRLNYGDDDERLLTTSDETQSAWGTILSSLRWSHAFGSKVFTNTTLWFSQYSSSRTQRYGVGSEGARGYFGNRYSNSIYDYGFRADVSIYPSAAALGKIRVGGWFALKEYRPVVRTYSTTAGDDAQLQKSEELNRNEFHTYYEESWRRGPLWLMAGLHFTIDGRSRNSDPLLVEPRLLAGWRINERTRLKIGCSLTSQNTYQVKVMNVATPADIWLPIPKGTDAQKAWQVSVASEWKLKADISLVVEAYMKRMTDLATYKNQTAAVVQGVRDWDEVYTSGEGYSSGVELFLHRRRGRVSGWVGYSLSRARSRYDGINDGRYTPSDNDRLHSVQVFASVKITPRAEVAASWGYGTGMPFSLPTQHYSLPGSDATYAVPAERNAMRMPSSHQLNVGCNMNFGDLRAGSTLSFGLYNAYGRKNPMFIYWKPEGDSESPTFSLKQFSLIAFPCPYVKYSIHF